MGIRGYNLETKKRIYVGLLAISLLSIMLLVFGIWYLIANRHIIVSQVLLITIVVVVTIILLTLGMGIIAIILMIIRSRTIPSLENITQLANELLFPLTIWVGKIIGIEKEKILKSFVSVNNYLVKSKEIFIPGKELMILIPHCLQNSECPHKITVDINNCKECGKCKICDLKKMAEKYNVTLKVATGGTLARKYIQENHPRAVIAIACERDLSSGIQDATGIPVLGVLNCRPNGPCFNTDVNLEQVEIALKTFCKGG